VKLKIEIDLDNAAFQDDLRAEVADILRQLAHRLRLKPLTMKLLDSNGNTVGKAEIHADSPTT